MPLKGYMIGPGKVYGRLIIEKCTVTAWII